MASQEDLLHPTKDAKTFVDPSMSRIHPVPGYNDTENMWVKLCNIEKQEINSNKYQNNKSVISIQVTERILKLKKNPLYRSTSKVV